MEVPYSQSWFGGARASDFAVTSLQLVDHRGRTLRLADEPSPGLGQGGGAEIRALLRETSPNPARGLTRVDYELPHSGPVTLTLFDAAGRRVRELYSGVQMAGPHTLRWDGQDATGREVPDGAYFLKLVTDQGGDSRKILVLK
ncbi:MAG: FlgD immunoglobulin-like domain containing protein [Candidatus Eisenbacteria bacterium]